VINKQTLSTQYTESSRQIGTCLVTRTGGSCSISVSTTLSASIGVALGMSSGAIASQLGVATSAGVSVTCSSPAMKAGQTWHAWPRGTRHSYQVRHVQNPGSGTTTSGALYAFVPRMNAITCG
jgi:hypothetical protein